MLATTPSSRVSPPQPWLSRLTLALICLLGLAAFFYPFFLSSQTLASAGAARAADAPLLFALLGPALLVLLLAELGSGQLSARSLAVLGVLTAVVAVLRLPAGPGDAPTFFFLIMLAGYVYGGRFGFLLGALALFVSALITGGVGPWLPFQMLVTGWLGLGTALLAPARRMLRPGGWGEIIVLCGYGYLWGLLFGALMNLWFWPYAGVGDLYWQPGLGLAETLRRYLVFYGITSFAWDSLRAIGNVLFIAVLGKPLLKELRRFRARFQFESG
ncbi:MAG: ECF transporter S component [Chloroflexaceae bacterium]|jgi:energy-coupling factor transport system substrate-specific component|nr:ECF transporter S component [Chloroflexaceae bacterium]